MPTWTWIVVAVIVIAVVLAAVFVSLSAGRRRRTEKLRTHFGPEYDRAVGQVGDQRAAEKELVARQQKRGKLDIVALSPDARSHYSEQWRAVQTEFVDNPSRAVGAADRLVTEVMHERGYPTDDFDQRAADLSVDHPDVVEHYRAAHTLHLAQERADIGTEAQREAFVHYRALFEKLVEAGPHTGTDTPKEARA